MKMVEQFKEFLKSLGLDDEKVDAVATGLAGAKIYLSAEEKIDERYIKLKGQKGMLERQLATASATIETLRKNEGCRDMLLNEITKYKNANAALQSKYDKDVIATEKKKLVIDALTKEGAIHANLLAASLDLSKIELKDGKLSGYAEQFQALKESYKDQFKVKDSTDDKGGICYYVPSGEDDRMISLTTEVKIKCKG